MYIPITLSPIECHAILQATVDMDPGLHKKIEDCAKQYTDNPSLYDAKEEMIKVLNKVLIMHRFEICGGDDSNFPNTLEVYLYNVVDDYSVSYVYDCATKTLTKK